MYGSFASNVDMQSGSPALGTPEYTKAAQASGQIARALGEVSPPGELKDFAEALLREKQNVLRCRRGIDPRDLEAEASKGRGHRILRNTRDGAPVSKIAPRITSALVG